MASSTVLDDTRMDTEDLPRKLVAVLYADVAGYSRLTEADEDATYLRLRDYLDTFFATIERHGGRVANTAGDAVLAMFDSAAQSLLCAARVQDELARQNASVPEERQVRFRIGLNLGDVIEDRGDIFGDGVNVAARLEGLAEPGGICLSGSFHDALRKRLPFDFEYLGEQQVKNIEKPVRAYRAVLKADAVLPEPRVEPKPAAAVHRRRSHARWLWLAPILVSAVAGLALWQFWPAPRPASEKPSLVVLPFTTATDGAEQASIADGITEDLITDLSRFSNLRVMAENTSSRYQGQSVSPAQVHAELGVDYVLEGSVRRSADRVRINVQLVNARGGHNEWAERYDRRLGEIFALQNEVAGAVADALRLRLTTQEQKLLQRQATNNFEAYELFLQGQTTYKQRTREAIREAQAAYKEAILVAPNYARPYGALAVALAQDYRLGWTDAPVETIDRALELARHAVALDSSLPQAYWALGYVHLMRKEYAAAADAAEQAIAVAPSYADGYGLLALIYNNMGRPDEAIKYTEEGMKLNPYYTWDYPYNLGRAYYYLGRYPEAIENLQEALERNENTIIARLFLIASYVRRGQQDDAEWEAEQVQIMSPSTTLSHLNRTLALQDSAQRTAFLEDLRQAGLPE